MKVTIKYKGSELVIQGDIRATLLGNGEWYDDFHVTDMGANNKCVLGYYSDVGHRDISLLCVRKAYEDGYTKPNMWSDKYIEGRCDEHEVGLRQLGLRFKEVKEATAIYRKSFTKESWDAYQAIEIKANEGERLITPSKRNSDYKNIFDRQFDSINRKSIKNN